MNYSQLNYAMARDTVGNHSPSSTTSDIMSCNVMSLTYLLRILSMYI